MLPAQVEATSHAPLLQVVVAAPPRLYLHAPVHLASVWAGRVQLVNVAPLDAAGSARHSRSVKLNVRFDK
jgi:hypothetical protein